MIDWQFFFLAWELKGKYPAILDQPVARELFDDANALLDEIIADGSLQAARRLRVLARPLRRRRHRASTGPDGVRFPMLRQQTAKPAGPAQPVPGRLRRPGRRPPRRVRGRRSTAPRSWPPRTRPSNDDYRAIMVKALADRLAEAFAEYIHLQARRDWFEPDAEPGWSRTCTPSGSAASGRRSATRPARTTA